MSSSSSSSKKHDVFLSFRGDDTRSGFISHLYDALVIKGVNTYRDDEKLPVGKSIRPELLQAIEESKFAIVVLSSGYANSTWCLDELAKIVECMKQEKLIVVPVFYRVNPSNVRRQKNKFGEAFAKHEQDHGEKVKTWRDALKQVGNLAGYHIKRDGNESESTSKIVKEIYQGLSVKSGIALPTTGVVVGQTFRRNCEKVLTCLKSDEILRMGIYGMGGVGKTTVMEHVHNQILADPATFGNVYWVTVSENFSIKRLQNDISRNVYLDLSKEDDEKWRAARLLEALNRKDKFILILDDVWGEIPLEGIGIPVGGSQCKLVLTTRSLDVCNTMVCRLIITILPLSEEEAWQLFMEKLGTDREFSLQVIEIAKRVAECCAGLPLGIITMAASMRGVNDIREWRTALGELKNPRMGLIKDLEPKVFSVLKYSYNHLGNEKLQRCFLNCALYPEDDIINRDELINYFIVEGLIEKSKSREAEIDTGHTVLNKLEKCCLLESSYGIRVKMHDLIRDMALQILRANEKVMVKAGVKLREIPEEEEWTEDLEKVSLMRNEITEIPTRRSPRCPRLSTLMLQRNRLRQIPDSFFVHLRGLRVLNLCDNRDLVELPNSIGELVNLNALLLRGCRMLRHIPSLGKLGELRDLDLGDTGIEEVPQGMEELINLKCLCMDNTQIVGLLPRGILPRLVHLQSFIGWSSRIASLEGVGVRAEEVMELKQLEVFKSRMHNLSDYNVFVRSKCFEQLRDCWLLVTALEASKVYKDMYYYGVYNKSVVLEGYNLGRRGGHDSISFEDGILKLRWGIQSLGIVNCTGKCVFDFCLRWNDATELKEIQIRECEEVEWVFPVPFSSSSSECVHLSSLEELYLFNNVNMKGIFNWWESGVISSPPCDNPSFSGLKKLIIRSCPKMKVGLTVNCLLHLPILEVLQILNCEQMEEIIGGGDEEEGEDNHSSGNNTNIAIALPKLRVLHVYDLPKLKSIYNKGKMICDSIQEITFTGCRKLKRIPLASSCSDGQASPFPALQCIDLSEEEKEWWESVELVVDKTLLQHIIQFTKQDFWY